MKIIKFYLFLILFLFSSCGTKKEIIKSDNKSSVSYSSKYNTKSGQVISHGKAEIINFDTKILDSSFGVVTTGEFWKFTAKEKGVYYVKAYLTIYQKDFLTANKVITSYLFKNGKYHEYLDIAKTQGITDFYAKNGSTVINLDVDDFIDVRLLQLTGVNQSLFDASEANYIIITKVGS